MGFYRSPNRSHFGSKIIDNVYIGCGDNENECILKFPNISSWFHFSERPDFKLTTSQGTFTLSGSCGGEPAYHLSGSSESWSIYFSNYFRKGSSDTTDGTWLLVKNAPYIGYIPRAGIDLSDDYSWTYIGDTWYSTDSLSTIGEDGAKAGTFTGVSEDVENETISAAIKLSPTPTACSSLVGNWGSFYVGFPTWNLSVESPNVNTNIFRRWNKNYVGLYKVDADNIDGVSCIVSGYIPTALPKPTTDPTGFWMALSAPSPKKDYTIKHWKFVLDDPEQLSGGGHLSAVGPSITASWVDYLSKDEVMASGLDPRSVSKQALVFEASIWR